MSPASSFVSTPAPSCGSFTYPRGMMDDVEMSPGDVLGLDLGAMPTSNVALGMTMAAGPEFDFDASELLELFASDHDGSGEQQTADAAATMGASLAQAQQQPVLQMSLTATATVTVPPPTTAAPALSQTLPTRQTALQTLRTSAAAVNKNNQKTETKTTAITSKPPSPPPPAATAAIAEQPSKPRRPLSAYNLFFKHERARLLALIERGESPSHHPPTLRVSPSEIRRLLDPSGNPYHVDHERRRHRRSHGKVSFRELFKIVLENWQGLSSEVRAPFEMVAGELEYENEVRPYKEWKRREQWKKSKQRFRERKRKEKRAAGKVKAGGAKSKGRATRRSGGKGRGNAAIGAPAGVVIEVIIRRCTEAAAVGRETKRRTPEESGQAIVPFETPPPQTPEPMSESPSTVPVPYYHPTQYVSHHEAQRDDDDELRQYGVEIEPIPCSLWSSQ